MERSASGASWRGNVESIVLFGRQQVSSGKTTESICDVTVKSRVWG